MRIRLVMLITISIIRTTNNIGNSRNIIKEVPIRSTAGLSR